MSYRLLSIIWACAIITTHAGIYHIAPEQMVINSRTEQIYHRFYIIKRLAPSIHLLQKTTLQQMMPFDALQPSIYRHKELKKAVEVMHSTKTFEPLFALWQLFTAYQHLYDALFKNELIELVYFIYGTLFSSPVSKKSYSLEQKLGCIDELCDEASSGLKRRASYSEIPEVTTDFILKRFFTIKRLNKSIQFLSFVHEQEKQLIRTMQRDSIIDTQDLLEELEHFSHDRIKECLIQMCKKKNIEPLIRLCNEFKQYRFAHDDTFLQEMLMNIFLVYKSMLLKNLSQQTEQVIMTEMNQVLEIYEHLDSTPLDETLKAIDMVTDKLIALQSIEKTNYKKYLNWLIPGSVCALCGVVLLGYMLT